MCIIGKEEEEEEQSVTATGRSDDGSDRLRRRSSRV